jgi:hypothetical protein
MTGDRLELPMFVPDATRSARVARQCRERLARRQRRTIVIERALVGGFSLAYLALMAFQTLRYW